MITNKVKGFLGGLALLTAMGCQSADNQVFTQEKGTSIKRSMTSFRKDGRYEWRRFFDGTETLDIFPDDSVYMRINYFCDGIHGNGIVDTITCYFDGISDERGKKLEYKRYSYNGNKAELFSNADAELRLIHSVYEDHIGIR